MSTKRAFLDATRTVPELEPLRPGSPVCLLKLLDRPFVQHVVEYLVRVGVKRIDILQGDNPLPLRECLGDGTRWGISIHYHLLPASGRRDRLIPSLQLEEESPLLMGDALSLPAKELSPEGSSVVWTTADGERSGWARLTGEEATFWLSPEADRESPPPSEPLPGELCRLDSASGFLLAQDMALSEQAGDLMLTGTTGEDGVWLGRNVVIHPTAVLTPPLFIGEDTRVGRGVHLGPGAVIGKACRIEDKSSVTHSLVLDNSYVGEFLELDYALVDRYRLLNTKHGQVVDIEDEFLLGSMQNASVHYPLLDKLLQKVLATLLLPFALLFRCVAGTPSHSVPVIQPPLGGQPDRWKMLPLQTREPIEEIGSPLKYLTGMIFPNLMHVLRGSIQLVGSPPYSREALDEMDPARRELYSGNRPGLIHESLLLYGPQPLPELAYATEAVYAVQAGSRFHLKLLFRFLSMCFLNPWKSALSVSRHD